MSATESLTEAEDFGRKYKEGKGLMGRMIDGYFTSVARLVARIPQAELHSALEIGCAEGFSTERLRSILNPNVKLEASEYVERQVPLAQARVPSVRVIQEDIYHLQRPDASIDLLFALEVMEHLDDVPAALGELHRASRRYIMIGVPNEPLWRIMHFLAGKNIRDWGNTPGHVNHWSTKALVKLLQHNNFRPIAVGTPTPWSIVLAEKIASEE